MLRKPKLTPNPLDPVEEKHPLLVVHEFAVVPLGSLAQDGPQALGFQYTGVGHRVASLWSGPSEVATSRRAFLLSAVTLYT